MVNRHPSFVNREETQKVSTLYLTRFVSYLERYSGEEKS